MRERVTIIRREHFNAAHRLHNEAWSAEKNATVFGRCSYPNYHGHNYELEVKLVGEVDPETGFVFGLSELSTIINTQVIERFDHKNLNLDTEEFKKLIPTAENIAIVIFRLLRAVIPASVLLQVKLYETPRNIAQYPYEPA